MSNIIIYTDGGARNNGSSDNVGGYGVVLQYGEHKKEIYNGERDTTNNIQELKGVITALKSLKTTNIPVEIFCDSAYVVNGANEWVKSWKKNGWKKKGGEIKNLELWKELDKLVAMQEDLKILKVRGHSDNEGNNRADELANIAMDIEEGKKEGLRHE